MSAQQSTIEGVVVEQRKYSIVVAQGDRDVVVNITPQTSVSLKIMRAKYDLQNRKIRIELPISAPDGVFENNEFTQYDLPDPLFIKATFPHSTAMQKAMKANVKRLVTFELGVPTDQVDPDDELSFTGQLKAGSEPDKMRLMIGSRAYEVVLGNRDARLLGFSILDLLPFRTDVFVQGEFEGEELFADEILFMPVGDALEREQVDLPRCLFLGDVISFNYQRPLREALDSLVNLHHPPENCRGSENWKSIPRWMGAYRKEGRGWDVITFNFGLWDVDLTKQQYQENLRNAIDELAKSNAKLIWVSSTPIDYGYNADGPQGQLIPEDQRAGLDRESTELSGRVTGRMRRQNEWAREVLKTRPEIAICDLWQVVKNGEATVYKDWWYSKRTDFEYPQSIPLARNLARYILQAAEIDESKIQPPSVHIMEVPEISDEPETSGR